MEPEMWMVGEQVAAAARDASAAAKRLIDLADGLTGAFVKARSVGMGDEELAGYASILGGPSEVVEALRAGDEAVLALILGVARQLGQSGGQGFGGRSVTT